VAPLPQKQPSYQKRYLRNEKAPQKTDRSADFLVLITLLPTVRTFRSTFVWH
jgi:hypothetical protein